MTWSDIKKRLGNLSEREVLALMKNLYELSPQNKSFLEARLAPGHGAALEKYRSQIRVAVDPKWGDDVQLRMGKKAISDYAKANPNDITGKVDLMLFYVECGTRYTLDYGDIDGPFYNSLSSMVERILQIAPQLPPEGFQQCLARMDALASKGRRIGWGYGGHLTKAANELARLCPPS